ncbi:MAG: ATP-binding protein [Methylicorpusculum sp.]|uniref:ATP-binding protein n=1 Tax=Methylicorpusculum sp. TaxID=2713644 RepID=UPI002716074B|nr:ATP-binding protein [Methylicorpusculum sp.]MDO8938522.1 ATP-binding protein [Methylicorpusculum sp.]MDP2202072.1 ATP-binding protein [Methylicorpusculum sp.]
MNSRFNPVDLFQTCVLIIFVMCAYFLLGLIGLQLAVPPSNAGAVWPPAGIALAAIVLKGPRVLPGIFLGNFSISAWALGFSPNACLIYTGTGLGATACAYTGYRLIKHFIGLPNPLLETQKIMLFFTLGGPVSCLIPATLGISLMVAMGNIFPADIPFNWFSWWVGDTIGVLVFAPLTLILFAKSHSIWRTRLNTVGTPLLLSFLLVSGSFLFIQQDENRRHAKEFERQTLSLVKLINERLQNHLQIVYGIRNLFTVSASSVDQAGFSFFTHSFFQQYPELKSLAYLSLSSQGSEIKNLIPYFIEPEQSRDFLATAINDPNLFFNFSSSFESTKHPTAFFEFIDENVIILTPVYKNSNNKKALTGVALSMFILPELLDSAFTGLTMEGIQVSIDVLDKKTGAINVHTLAKNQLIDRQIQHQFKLSDQNWLVNFFHDKSHIHAQYHWSLWWYFTCGLFFISVMGVGLLALTGRHAITESIVNERTRDLLKAKNTAETANTAKNHFLAKISHELRTPLNGIMGFTQLLQNNQGLGDDEKQHVNIIRQCSQDLLDLINDILDFTAIETNNTKVVNRLFDFTAFLNDIDAIYQLIAAKKGLKLTTSINNAPIKLRGDEKRIRQILCNLLNNAFKYTDHGQIQLIVNASENELYLTVADTGNGIAQHDMDRIFDPFIQLNNHDAAQEGIGIGLTITKELLKIMNGRITVQSDLGAGSIFTVTLPIENQTTASS